MSQVGRTRSFTPTYHTGPYAAISPKLPGLSKKDKTVVITGGGRGIGLAITTAFAEAGASHIVLLQRDTQTMANVKASIEKEHPSTTVHAYAAAITDIDKVAAAFADVRSKLGEPHILILCAAASGVMAETLSLPFEDIRNTFEVNVMGSLNVTHQFLDPAYPKQGKVLVNISTAGIHIHNPKMAAYGATKEAFVHFMATLHDEEFNNGVRIMNLHPGTVWTDMAQGAGLKKEDRAVWDKGAFSPGSSVCSRVDLTDPGTQLNFRANSPYGFHRLRQLSLLEDLCGRIGTSTN